MKQNSSGHVNRTVTLDFDTWKMLKDYIDDLKADKSRSVARLTMSELVRDIVRKHLCDYEENLALMERALRYIASNQEKRTSTSELRVLKMGAKANDNSEE